MKARQTKPTADIVQSESETDWVKTPIANCVRYKPSGVFFARVRIRGKLFRQSLKTDVMSVAKLRLNDFIKEKQEIMGDVAAAEGGKLTVGGCLAIFRSELDGKQDIKEGTKVYRRKCIEALLRTWAGIETLPVGKVGKEDCLAWAKKIQKYSPSVYNNTVGTLRMILDVAVERGARAQNPARFITKKRIDAEKQRRNTLPTPEQFERFMTEIETAGAWCSRACADLVRFLAFGGFRKTEAAHITWEDVDLDNRRIRVRITKNGKPRTVPMIADMVGLMNKLKAERLDAKSTDKVMSVRECQKAMDRAAKVVGMARITHHDLRHLFATRCIETGVDVPTVSRWLGHKDGGALAMKVYGHLRDHHSVEMAQKVSFTKPATAAMQDRTPKPEQTPQDKVP